MAEGKDSPADLLQKLQDALGGVLPGWAVRVLLVLVLVAGLITLLNPWGPVVRSVVKGVKWIFSRTDRRRAARRARFADHIESQMRRLGEKEEWRDNRYAELEAELEIVGRRVNRLFRRGSFTSLRRVPSLSVALEESKERIVLLEGEPGSGKSVAMRHLAQRMAAEAMRKPSESSVIPMYVNLKMFRPATTPPTSADVRDFVIASVNSVRDRDVERFLQDEFERGIADGTWLFLFDSFDEIPDILSATEADEVIAGYADAVHAFLHGMNQCRGVVASREFRGPGRAAWPTFRVVPLSEKRKINLIEKSELERPVERTLRAELPGAEAGVQQMSSNPLFLSLLCEHMREGNDFPTNVHSVLETYVEHRLARDAGLVAGHFQVSSDDVRVVAEELAFLMADRESLGLNVDRAEAVSLVAASLGRSEDEMGRALDGLVYTKLARTGDSDSSVTFAHRRLQEYFATCVVIREPDRVDVRALLTSGRWRETAVTILQTQRAEQAAPLLDLALELLPAELPEHGEFGWPRGALYVLNILAEGASPALLESVPEIQRRAGLLLTQAWERGMRYDRKWALESCSAADSGTCERLLTDGFASESEWLRQEAFAQVRKVPHLAHLCARQIRQMLLDLSVGGRLRRERRSVLTQIRRLPHPAKFEKVLWTLVAAPFVHIGLVVLLGLSGFMLWNRFGNVSAAGCLVLLAIVAATFFQVRLMLCTLSSADARMRVLMPYLRFRDPVAILTVPIVLGLMTTAFPPLFLLDWHSAAAAVVVGQLVVTLIAASGTIAVVRLEQITLGRLTRERVLTWLFKDLPVMALVLVISAAGIALLVLVIVGIGQLLGDVDRLVPLGGGVLAVLMTVMITRWVAGRIAERRRVKEIRAVIAKGGGSLEVFRTYLRSVDTVDAVCVLFNELHKKDTAWPDDVMDFSQRLARMLEGEEQSLHAELGRPSWSGSSEALDSVSIFLGAVRRKAEYRAG